MEQQIHTAEELIELVYKLPAVELAKFHKLFKDCKPGPDKMEEYLTEKRFSGGRVCPICGGTHVQRNGRRKNGSQKFVCRDCRKTFSIRKNTIFNGTHKSMAVWNEYMACMAEGLSLDKSAERCGISHGTSFVWRHKILDAISEGEKGMSLGGIVEADETFVAESYKGNAALFASGAATRVPRKRGGGNHSRGLSDELVCVPCAMDREGNAISKVAKLGKCSSEALEQTLGGHVSPDATLCSDGESSYRNFSKGNGNKLVQIKGGRKAVKGIFHIQHINAYHSKLKRFLDLFKGVSSKYLNNYLTWNNVVEHKGGTLREKEENLLLGVVRSLFEETCGAIPQRPILPILVENQS